MTMPMTAEVIKAASNETLESWTDQQLDDAIRALRKDLPGTIDFIESACQRGAHEGGFTYLSKSPDEMMSKQDWNRLVGYLARLFASPYRRIVQEWSQRRYGVDVAFVNCCIIATEPDGVNPSKLWRLQTDQQLTPDC